ncbi:oxygen-independent coproporphyrinogen III oxidase [Helicobacter trogontum]|uniref:Coproporphyrinogen-III oxidase n=1 Tax=Helicobacter trogontum TaxID=50960 RepID=A0A4U8TFT9_9HELI|nr:oxygen-independent coproporphyrinogen III oxidase [Helicobacter trogontum]MDY5185885.1 oxygen-independent coproporphyrinogen III oxidase [Helicobacter trogontum]TLD98863.1 oxygen-independent coproporphyrinogen III oxidase [Helicobacter trogontum]
MYESIDFSKLAKYSKPGPRYTSYPTANEFHKDFNAVTLLESFKRADSKYKDKDLSLYTHLPFCKSACYFCGCNVIYTSKEDKKERYIQYLKKELTLLKDSMDTTRKVVQFHFGGGTPTFFDAGQLQTITQMIKDVFPNFSESCEISCEIDPRHFNEEQMVVLKNCGFNRISFGVQDFDMKVQQHINRIQPFSLVENSVALARKYDINSINFDLIYGLPYQNEKSFANTLESVIKLSPERLAIFNYAHVPWVKKTMRKIDETTLPSPEEKLKILQNTIEFLHDNDYEMIGMDHFAKKNDTLCVAKHEGELRRNFQGYTTKGFSQTIGIGLTAIGEGVDYYTQNHKDMANYEASLDNNTLPVAQGILLSPEDILRKEVIMSLMNNAKLDFNVVNRSFGIDCIQHFSNELEALKPMCELGLLTMDSHRIEVSATGKMLIRNIAMIFDTYFTKNITKQFSKTI